MIYVLGGIDVGVAGQKEITMYVHALGRFGRALATAFCTLFFCTYRIQMMIPLLRFDVGSVSSDVVNIPPRRVESMTRETGQSCRCTFDDLTYIVKC